MNTTLDNWQEKLNNLHARSKGISSEHQINYKLLLSNIAIGNNVLDIGCGTCWLKSYLPKNTKYVGLDVVKKTEHSKFDVKIGAIEDFFGYEFDTLFVFAALDGMRDLDIAFKNMKDIACKNIVILTGVNIQPDLYHTHLITEEYLDSQMEGWKKTFRSQVHEKIIFVEYSKL